MRIPALYLLQKIIFFVFAECHFSQCIDLLAKIHNRNTLLTLRLKAFISLTEEHTLTQPSRRED